MNRCPPNAMPVAPGFDPLGRIAAQASLPYPAPVPGLGYLQAHFLRHYDTEAAGLSRDELVDALAEAQRELTEIKSRGVHVEGAAIGQATARRVRLAAQVAAYEAAYRDRQDAGDGAS